MKYQIPASLLILATLAWPVAAETAPAAPTPNAAHSTAAAPAAKPALNKGMTGEEIIAIIGKPAEVKPMAAAEGKAEVWTYRRLLRTDVRQVATHMESVPTAGGVTHEGKMYEVSTQQPVYKLERTQVYQVTALLMFEGKLLLAKQWEEKASTFD